MPWQPYHPNTLFVRPFRGEGFSRSGLYVDYDDRLPPTLAHSDDLGVVIFRPHTFETAKTADGTELHVLSTKAVAGILEGYEEEAQKIKENYVIE